MSRWGALTPVEPGLEMSNDAFALALKSLFAPAGTEAHPFSGRVRVKLVRDAFDIEATAGAIDVRRANGADPALVIEGAESALRAVMFHRRPLDDAVEHGDVRIDGERAKAAAFLQRFALPQLTTDVTAA